MKAIPQIYIKSSDKAAVFYQEAFGLTFGMTAQKPDGSYEHVSLMSGENEFIAIGEDSEDMHGDTGDKVPHMAFNVGAETRDEVDRAYAILNEGARKILSLPGSPWWDEDGSGGVYSFGLVDKYGVFWDVIFMKR